MTVLARKIASIPQRSATETWSVITTLLRADGAAKTELENVTGIACTLIARETIIDATIIVHGNGPRVRIYCLHGTDAMVGDDANEQALGFHPTAGDWKMSLPCPAEDLQWVQEELSTISTRIAARDATEKAKVEKERTKVASNEATIDVEEFLRK